MSTLLDEFFDLAENSIESVVIESDGEESLYDDYPEDVIQEDGIIYDMITRTIIIPNNELSDIQKQKLQKIIDTLNNPVIIMTQDSLFNQIKIDNNAKVEDILPQLTDTVKESLMNEAKQVGPLYHATTLKGLLGICKNKVLTSYNPNGISFTRDKNFFYQDYPFMLVLDGDAISSNNIVFPYDWSNSHEDILRRRESETSVLPGGYKRPDFITKHNLDFINEKTLKLRDNYVLGLIINPEYRKDPTWDTFRKTEYDTELKSPEEVIEVAKTAFKQAFPNAEIKDIANTEILTTDQKTASNESVLDEGDEKIFDKKTGYNSSSDELYIFDLLKKKYPNIIMSYTDDRFVSPETHRHWQIDFYDPDSDTAFNYNKNWRHGRRKYNPDDPGCQKDLLWLKSKAKPGNYYEKVLHTWTELEPLKRKVAKEAGLKLIEWFNLIEFEKWYENPQLTYEEYKTAPESMQYDSDEYFANKELGYNIYGNDSTGN